MKYTMLALLLGAFSSCALAAADVEAQCKVLTAKSYPAAHRAPAAEQGKLAGCVATKLYYGIGTPVDHVRARQCALAATEEQLPFQEDKGVLMMVYANGQGVPRDYALARKAACEAGGAVAETALRLEHLAEMEAGRDRKPIDVCDDATSGYMGGWCASVANDLKEQKRGAGFARLIAPWSAPQKQAFARLETRAHDFFEQRSTEEVDLSGTARAAFTIEEEARQREDLRASVAAFEKGALPRDGDAEFARLDARLNAVYKQLKALPEPQYGTIRFDGVQRTQRSWLAYRDAWVAFGKVKYPQVSANAWRAYFTRKRIAMLEKLLKNWGS
ncbi:lysozyme inhibitor LprI family protein [uncultured Massilia sp.]|uniref:lysozyme inhibitor LprI family protein n=1 Tax=uncultured Massilia sp. TaxID=169973 RepID=UPI00258DFFAD|nr:lysozyme inhibitor LprI family protein [uncultured Massilia sp.]